MQEQRLDKWLWCARLVKTRSFATKLIAAGKVRVNGQRVLKVSRPVRLGDVVTGTAASRFFVVRVAGESRPPRLQSGRESRPIAGRGPTKRDYRRWTPLRPKKPDARITGAAFRCRLTAVGRNIPVGALTGTMLPWCGNSVARAASSRPRERNRLQPRGWRD
jgi:ribosome-associated heat shock protein Hsp15